MSIESISDNPIKTREIDSIEDILAEAKKRIEIADKYWSETFSISKEDEKFIAGDQWDDIALKAREEDGRPAITINQLQQYISRLHGAQRKQAVEIKVSPTESTSKEIEIKTKNGDDLKLSKVYEGAIRNIQSISNAKEHYSKAYRDALTGVGFLRVLTDYSRNDSFDLDIIIKHISNRYSVLIDPSATESDKSDMNYAFITEYIPKKEFIKRYGDKIQGDLVSFDDDYDEDKIAVSEYFRREPTKRTLLLLSSGETVFKDEVLDVLDELKEQGIEVEREREIKTYKVVWCKITANDILEKEREFPTNTIPIVPVFGREIEKDGKKLYSGAITNAKDPQVMLNYSQTAAIERIALSPKSPFIAEAEAIEGHEAQWQTANIKNWAILKYNKGYARPSREQPTPTPIAEINMAGNMQQSIQSSIGIYDASIGKAGNETSGRAILARQGEADAGTFEFSANLANALRRVGILLLDLIPKVYDTERILRIKNIDGTGDFVEINKTVPDEETGENVVINDIAAGKYDVTVTTGSSYATKRIETAESMISFMQAVPQAASVASDLLAENMDFNNSDAIADRLRRTLPANILSKEEQEERAKNSPEPKQEQQAPTKEQTQLQIKQLELEAKLKELEISLQIKQVELEKEVIKLQATKGEITKKELSEEEKDNIAKTIAQSIKK